jgi:hypothetical protein
MTNFVDALNRKADEVERPKPLPVGTYLCTIPGPPEMKTIGKNSTPAAEFSVKVIQPREDVDSEALLAVGGAGGKTLRLTFYLTEDALFRLKEFLVDTCGIEPGGRTLGEMIPEAVNRMFNVTVKHRPSQDGTQIYAEIAGTAKA